MCNTRQCSSVAGSAPALDEGQAAGSINVARNVPELRALRADWEYLLHRHGVHSPYNDPDRFAAEMQARPDVCRPHVAVLRDRGQPRALIIGRLEHARTSWRVGYCPIITPKVRTLYVVAGGLLTDGSNAAADAVREYLLALLEQRAADLLIVNHLPLDHPLYAPLLAAGARASTPEPHWRRRIVGSHPHRTDRRMDRVLSDHFGGDVRLRVFQHPDQLEEFIRGAVAISSQTYQMRIGAGFTASPLWRRILATEMTLGRSRCYWLVCRGEPVAFLAGGIYADSYHGYFMGYLPNYASLSPGSVLHMRALQDLHARGVQYFDYGFGEAGYKKRYGTERSELAVLRLYGRSLRGQSVRAIETCVNAANRAGSACLERLGVRDWLKKRWRALLSGGQ